MNPPHSRRAKVTRSRVSTHIEAENGPDANPYFSSRRPGLGGLPLDKTTPNPPLVVKRTSPPERLIRSKTPVFKGLAFDQRRANQPVSFGPSGSVGNGMFTKTTMFTSP